ncbi:hypothetical protein [Tenacibaculum halocynthiae]|uniref:hypothetical protein n=1 Tax=Tenacibaculum halocynthiae TaxID=1254437 RepID=UPI003D650E23
MNTYANRKEESKNQLVSSANVQIKSNGESAFQFVDNRATFFSQQKLQLPIQKKEKGSKGTGTIVPKKSNAIIQRKPVPKLVEGIIKWYDDLDPLETLYESEYDVQLFSPYSLLESINKEEMQEDQVVPIFDIRGSNIPSIKTPKPIDKTQQTRESFNELLQKDTDGEGGYFGNHLGEALKLLNEAESLDIGLHDTIQEYVRTVEDAKDPIYDKILFHTQNKGEQQQFKKTENGLYFINPNDRTCMYGLTSASSPMPSEFFNLKFITIDGVNVIRYTPNVRFLSKDEHDTVCDKKTKQKDSGLNREFKLSTGFFSSKKVNVGAMISELKHSIRKDYDLTASKGVLGGNDCAIWAQNLQRMIREELQEKGVLPSRNEGMKILNVATEEINNLRKGDMMVHDFEEGGSSCGWHAATVIAQDGSSSITLEAHASKDLIAPEFHIRNGILGFVRDNNTAYDEYGNPQNRNLGGTVRFSPVFHERVSMYKALSEVRSQQGFELEGNSNSLDWTAFHAQIDTSIDSTIM